MFMAKHPSGGKKQSFARELRKSKYLFIMLLPAVVYFIIFNYVPMGGIIVAFKNYRLDRGILGSAWNGLENFRFFFNSGKAFILTMMTVGYNAAFIVTGMFWSISLALVLSELKSKLFKKITHSIIFLPYFISWVVVAFMAYNLFSTQFGVINTLLRGWGRDSFNFYGSPNTWRYLLVIFSNWKGVGYGSIIYLAVLTGVSPEYYDAAQVDGAGIWQRIRYISLPFLKPTMVVLLLMSLGGVFRGGGEMFYQLIGNNTLLSPKVDVIDSYILRSLVNPLAKINYSMMAAVGLYQQAAGFILLLLANAIARRVNPDSALF
jgi:putative aldouronate transport system permease protein